MVSIAITCGDPAGIGPEVALRAVAETAAAEDETRVLVGPRAAWEAAAKLTGIALPPPGASILDAGSVDPSLVFSGRSQAETGLAGFNAVECAVDEAVAGRAQAVVTAPIDKAAWRLAGKPWPGHTGYLAHRAGGVPVVMAFVAGDLVIGLVTEHLPLREVPSAVTAAAVLGALEVLDRGLRETFGQRDPEIAVCGLNPHAGEQGLLGAEDRDVVAPALAVARERGIRARGPFPADGLFARIASGAKVFHAVLALYHDQGLIAAKVLGRGRAVNLTLGLPFVRTSPDHGTAYDIAGKGQTDPGSMAEALKLATGLCGSKR